jgi:dual-specificity kinase/CDC-like kinase
LETLEFLHSFRLIHTDLKPENILLLNGRQVPQRGGYSIPESTRIKVIDFGGATYDNEKKSSIVNTRQYRAPEVILGVGWSMPSDLWSIGCILAELYQGELLFATHDNIEHLALIERVIGPFPRKMQKRAKNTDLVDEAFDSSGSHRMDSVLPADQLSYVKRIAPLDSIITYDEDAWFLWLLRRILIINPDERATAQECLRKF